MCDEDVVNLDGVHANRMQLRWQQPLLLHERPAARVEQDLVALVVHVDQIGLHVERVDGRPRVCVRHNAADHSGVIDKVEIDGNGVEAVGERNESRVAKAEVEDPRVEIARVPIPRRCGARRCGERGNGQQGAGGAALEACATGGALNALPANAQIGSKRAGCLRQATAPAV